MQRVFGETEPSMASSGAVEIDLSQPLTAQEMAPRRQNHTNPHGLLVQREALKVTPVEDAGKVTDFQVRGRPANKQRTEELDQILSQVPAYQQYYTGGKLRPGFIRAHIIGWNVKQREFIQSLGLPKTQEELIAAFNADNFGHVIGMIKHQLNIIFYDPSNYTINSEAAEQEDRDALRAAAQQYHEMGDQSKLPEIFKRSFNTGLDGKGAGKVHEYIQAFSKAYGVPVEVLATWPLRIPKDVALDEEDEKDFFQHGKEKGPKDAEELDIFEDDIEPPVEQGTLSIAGIGREIEALGEIGDELEMLAPGAKEEHFQDALQRYQVARERIDAALKRVRYVINPALLKKYASRLETLDNLAREAQAYRDELD